MSGAPQQGRCMSGAPQQSPCISVATEELAKGICGGHRAALARGITLVESTHPGKAEQARLLVQRLTGVCKERAAERGVPGVSFRIGLSGPPGAGKSTFTEALGKKVTGLGHRVAVLAVDPSSGTTGVGRHKRRYVVVWRSYHLYIT